MIDDLRGALRWRDIAVAQTPREARSSFYNAAHGRRREVEMRLSECGGPIEHGRHEFSDTYRQAGAV